MNLTDHKLSQLNNPALTPEKHALLRCRIAAELIHTGQYEDACQALGDFWQGVGKRPNVKRLTTSTTAEILLQCGVLSGWLGSVRHVPDSQGKAKDLLTEALRKFQSQDQRAKVSEVEYELGMCYFRLGSYNESRVVLEQALEGLKDTQLKAKVLIRRTLVEVWTCRYRDALKILEEAQKFFESCGDAIKGRWHGQMGLVFRRLATAENRTDYADRAIMEFTAAAYRFEQARHERYCASALNNLAMLHYKQGRYEEAYEHLDRAAGILLELKDEGSLAQVKETRSRVLVAEHRYKEANKVIAGAIRTFEKGSEYGLLADALSIQGVVWSRLGLYESSIHVIRRAMSVAQDAGALAEAGLAALTLIEEHGEERLTESEVYAVYGRADEWLRETQDAEHVARLRACARVVIRRLSVFILKPGDEEFSLHRAMEAYEAKLIADALEGEGGSVSRGAKRLGISHQSLIQIINTRHRKLLHKRTPPVRRKRSIIARRDSTPKRRGAEGGVRPVTILHAEDNEVVADAVKETLEAEGWRVVTCADGAGAFNKIAGNTRFDLFILDNELPDIKGLELVLRARQLAHRRRTPIIMLSAGEVEKEAWRAGVDAFLRKPEDVGELTGMVARLLSKDAKEH